MPGLSRSNMNICREGIYPQMPLYNLHEAKCDNTRGQETVYYQRARNYCFNFYANYILIGIQV